MFNILINILFILISPIWIIPFCLAVINKEYKNGTLKGFKEVNFFKEMWKDLDG